MRYTNITSCHRLLIYSKGNHKFQVRARVQSLSRFIILSKHFYLHSYPQTKVKVKQTKFSVINILFSLRTKKTHILHIKYLENLVCPTNFTIAIYTLCVVNEKIECTHNQTQHACLNASTEMSKMLTVMINWNSTQKSLHSFKSQVHVNFTMKIFIWIFLSAAVITLTRAREIKKMEMKRKIRNFDAFFSLSFFCISLVYCVIISVDLLPPFSFLVLPFSLYISFKFEL